MTSRMRYLTIGALAALIAAAGILAFAEPEAPGLSALPGLGSDELAGLKDPELLVRVQTDISRRAGKDWRRLPAPQRHLFVLGSLEEGLLQGGGFLVPVLAERDAATARRPRLEELAEAYRWLGLADAAEAVAGALRTAGEEKALLDTWAAYDLSDPNRGPQPKNPFAAADQRFRVAVRPSPGKRIAWVRAHPDEVLAAAE